MKPNRIIRYLPLALVALAFLFAPLGLLAQDSAPAAPAAAVAPVSPEAQGFILSLITEAVAKWPWLAVVVAFVGSMRLWAKPVFSAVHTIIELTPTKWDDGLWAKVFDFFTRNPVGISLAWLLDWLGSVKIVPPGAGPRQLPPGE